jgi:hypothetical protein
LVPLNVLDSSSSPTVPPEDMLSALSEEIEMQTMPSRKVTAEGFKVTGLLLTANLAVQRRAGFPKDSVVAREVRVVAQRR